MADVYSGGFFFTAKTANYEEILTGSRSNFAELTRKSLIVSSSAAMIPALILALRAQRHIIKGLTVGAVKGGVGL